jgi:hypothetical protein
MLRNVKDHIEGFYVYQCMPNKEIIEKLSNNNNREEILQNLIEKRKSEEYVEENKENQLEEKQQDIPFDTILKSQNEVDIKQKTQKIKKSNELIKLTDINNQYQMENKIIGIFVSRVIQSKTLTNKERITLYTYLEFEESIPTSVGLVLSKGDSEFLKKFVDPKTELYPLEKYKEFQKNNQDKVFEMYEVGGRTNTGETVYSKSFTDFIHKLCGLTINEDPNVFYEDGNKKIYDTIQNNSETIFQTVDKQKLQLNYLTKNEIDMYTKLYNPLDKSNKLKEESTLEKFLKKMDNNKMQNDRIS